VPRFHFHFKRGPELFRDDEGAEFPDIAAAREEALASARELLANVLRTPDKHPPECFIIADADGRELATVNFRDALPPNLRN
jgi:hypothetical protein